MKEEKTMSVYESILTGLNEAIEYEKEKKQKNEKEFLKNRITKPKTNQKIGGCQY